MRCGFCIKNCITYQQKKNEAYSPRGRLSILNGLVYGELELNDKIYDIFHSCTLCGMCFDKCPSKVNTLSIYEKVREIIHN
ncbi:MAG: (Fe-S)-binding protein [Candidatus Lokiarchaeota archaeon]|nr:(Fe-S)-binding protein [Candidatus Lokiarchaeota archaeon]